MSRSFRVQKNLLCCMINLFLVRGKETALKFGAEFRVYDKGYRPGAAHARWILYTAKEYEKLSWHDFAAKNRIAHSAKKNLLLAIVDDEGDVSYYEVSWLRP